MDLRVVGVECELCVFKFKSRNSQPTPKFYLHNLYNPLMTSETN